MPHFEPCSICGKIDCKCLCGVSGIANIPTPPTPPTLPTPPIRTFETGATRDTDQDKLDYEGYLSPFVLQRFAQYMRKHQVRADGCVRKSDDWQKGIPKDVYMKGLVYHLLELWLFHRIDDVAALVEAANKEIKQENIQDTICAILFNAQGYLFELLKSVQPTQCPQRG